MKAKTRERLAARGLGPLVRPGRPGRGRRGALAPDRGDGIRAAGEGGAAVEAPSAVRGDGPLGEVLEPPAGSVRERVRLRPVVREALDAEAGRLGMTREALCRLVLEEVAREAAGGPAPGSALVVPDAEDGPPIPAGYVGASAEDPGDALSAGPDPLDAGDAAGDGIAGEGGPEPADRRALLPVGRGPARERVPVRAVRGARRPGRFGRPVRAGGAWAAALAFALLAALSAAAAVSWRYEAVGTPGGGVYVVDRWRGAVWRCGAAGGGRPPACAQAVFRRPAAGGDVAYLRRVAR